MSISWADFSGEIVALCRATRAPNTATKMAQTLREFGSLPGVATTADLTTTNVAAFTAASDRRRKPVSTAGLLTYLRWAATYAVDTRRLEVHPWRVWRGWSSASSPTPSPHSPQATPKHIPRDGVFRVLRLLASRRGTWDGRRLLAVASTFAYTALRTQEGLRLRVEDVDLARQVIQVVARRRLKRPTAAAPVPVPDALAAVLGPWIEEVGAGWLFPGVRGKGPWTGGMAGRKPVDHLQAAGRECGVPGLTFRSLRHSWATHAESHWGLGELAVQRVLRHTRPRTQDHYRHADVANLVALVKSIDYGPASASAA